MKKTDIGVIAFIYAVCGLFFYMTFDLKAEAQTYPLFIIALLFILTTGYVIKMIIGARKKGIISGLNEVFKDFLPQQFFLLLLMIIIYLIAMYFIGFYISTGAFVIISLLYLKIKIWQILLSLIVLLALIYSAFSLFLGVHLPVGILFM